MAPRILLGILVGATAIGCAGNDEPKETPGMREALTKPPKFDLDKVPPEHRAMVEAMTTGRGGNPAAAPPKKDSGKK